MTDDTLAKAKTNTEDALSTRSSQIINNTPSRYFANWEIVLSVLTNAKKKLRLRILDTVFLQSENSRSPVSNWYFTSKNGELVRRTGVSNITLHHVYDRFCRLALTGPNASGPRIVAVGYSDNNLQKNRITLTAEQFQRDAKSQKASLAFNCSVLQCFISPSLGNGNFFQGVYSCTDMPLVSPHDKQEKKREVVIYAIEDFITMSERSNGSAGNNVTLSQVKGDDSALIKWVQKEIEVVIMKIIHELERVTIQSSIAENKVSTLSANFVLDGQKNLWLINTFNVISLLDQRQNGFDVGDFQQRDALPRLITRRTSILRNETKEESSKRCQVEDVKKKHSHDKISGRKPSEKGGSYERTPSPITSNPDELSRVEETISQLKNEFAQKTQARDEHLSMIKAIRSRISSELEIGTSLEKNVTTQKQCLYEISKEKEKRDQDTLVPVIRPDSSEYVLSEVETGNFEFRDEPEVYHHSTPETGEYNETIARLHSDLDDVSHRLRDELFEKNELRRKMDMKVSELSESLERTKDEIQILEAELSNEKIKNEKAMEQLKSSNRVLQAELVCQREYVEKMRSSSLTDLASQLREGFEIITAHEIAKSNIGTEQSLKACEERWKKRFEEINQEHVKEKTILQEKHQHELRYRQSQCQIQVEQSRIEIEDRLQLRFSESLKAAIAHKEAQRQLDLKRENKRWEQMMSEMKARLHGEYQQQRDKALKDRDQKWKWKMEQELKVLHQTLKDEKRSSQLNIEKNNNAYEEKLQKRSEVAEQEKREALDKALKDAEELWLDKMAQRERDLVEKVNVERDALEIKAMQDSMMEFSRALDLEKEKVLIMEQTISDMKKQNEEEKKELIDLVEKKTNEIEILTKEKKAEGELASINELQEEAEKMKKYYTEQLEDAKKSNDTYISRMREEWNTIIEAQIQATKLEYEKDMEEAIGKLEFEHEEQIHAIEYESSWLASQKEKAEEDLKNLKNQMNDKEGIVQSLQEEMNLVKITHSFNLMFMITKAYQSRQNLLARNTELSSVIEQLREEHSEAETKLSSKVKLQEGRISKLEGKMKLISSTLLNHKRDVLLDHKVKSRDVASKISEISDKIALVESKRKHTNDILQELIKTMQEIEKRLQEHSQISALQGDKVNTSHTRKKRRLDEEYEQILCKIDMKREDLYSVEEEAKKLHTEKAEAHDEMRKLEKSLVGLLVEQQKTLLSISTENDV